MEQFDWIEKSAAFDVSGTRPPGEEIECWRCAERVRLLAVRNALTAGERRDAEATVIEQLDRCLMWLRPESIAFYWPFRGEIDLRSSIRRWTQSGSIAALPVVGTKNNTVAFMKWEPKIPSRASLWGVPIPQIADEQVVPEIILVPLVGFDDSRFFLGNGTGYYDRALQDYPKAVRVGVAFESLHIDSVLPLPHDVALDLIITDSIVRAAHESRPEGRRCHHG